VSERKPSIFKFPSLSK